MSGANKRKQQKRKEAAKAAAASASASASSIPEIKSTLKDEGNKLFQDKKYDEACHKFTQAIAEDPTNAVLYSNRSAVYNTIQKHDLALKDADKALELNPKWGKGWLRKGAAHEGLMQLSKAQESYQQGLVYEPEDSILKKALDELSLMLEEMKQSHAEAALQDNPEGDRFSQMTDWLREGGAKFPYLYLQYYSEDYRGVHAATKVPNNKIVLEVPLSHIMTSDVAKASDIGKKIIASGCELGSSHSYLAAYLLQEKHNPNSYWKPYMRVLPEKYRNMPIFFDAHELSYLKGSFSIKKIQDRQEELKEEYDNICRHVPEFRKYTHDEFVWARLVVITRIFGLVVSGNKTDGLVPMADMLNHKRPRETSWTYDDSRGGFTITTLRALNRGEQIYDSYGRKCNSRFFVNYGFSLEENEDNQVALFVGLDDKDPQYPLKIRMLGEEGRRIGPGKRRFQIPMDYKEKVTKECFSFLRFAHAKDSELMLLSSSDQDFNVNSIEPISIRNELEVIEHLAEAAKEVLAGFDTSLEEDNRILKDDAAKLTMNIRNAILMRRGEKEVLHYYIDLAKEMKPLIEMPWKDFKRVAAKCYTGTGRFDSYITSVIVPMKKNDH